MISWADGEVNGYPYSRNAVMRTLGRVPYNLPGVCVISGSMAEFACPEPSRRKAVPSCSHQSTEVIHGMARGFEEIENSILEIGDGAKATNDQTAGGKFDLADRSPSECAVKEESLGIC